MHTLNYSSCCCMAVSIFFEVLQKFSLTVLSSLIKYLTSERHVLEEIIGLTIQHFWNTLEWGTRSKAWLYPCEQVDPLYCRVASCTRVALLGRESVSGVNWAKSKKMVAQMEFRSSDNSSLAVNTLALIPMQHRSPLIMHFRWLVS